MFNFKIEWCTFIVCYRDKNMPLIKIEKRKKKTLANCVYTYMFSTRIYNMHNIYTANKSVDQLFMDMDKSDANRKSNR